MRDIIVTTPRAAIESAAREAEDLKMSGGGYYFRNLGRNGPKHLEEGDRVFYVEDGFVRGYARVSAITYDPAGMVCDTTGNQFAPGVYVVMDGESWTWIRPIPMKGFQGWRYSTIDDYDVVEVGGWLDPKPAVEL